MAEGDRLRRVLPEYIHRASDTTTAAVEDVGVDHCGADVPVTQ